MTIKYHQNGTGNEYGADHQLTNNWNPDADYGNEYTNVYFRISTKGYDYPSYCFTEEDRKNFDSDLVEVFTSLGWSCEEKACGGSCAIWHKGKQHLYLHPQNFSGEVLKNDIKEIAEALEKRESFYLRYVDLYETVYDITDQEYEEILTRKDEEIKTAILKNCRTGRTNKFYYTSDVVRGLSNRFGLKRPGKEKWSGVAMKHILDLIKSLVEKGYLVSASDGNMVRTINKTEQRQRKLFVGQQ